MAESRLNVVTGAFSYSGRYITRRLLAMGEQVKTITGHPREDDEFGERVQAVPFNFDKPDQLVEGLRGADTLYNTYWIRFEQGERTFDKAVANSRTLIQAAEDAGVRRIVHVSIANPSADSDLPYYRGKALVEQAIRESGLSYAILGPTVLFGDEGILINNIAWYLRRMPVFAIPGSGEYRMQPTYVDDLAALAVEQGHRDENIRTDAVGPEQFTFNGLLKLIADTVHSSTLILHLPPRMVLLTTQAIGAFVEDVVLTREEVEGLTRNLLVSSEPAICPTKLSDWLAEHADTVGRHYLSEVKKHYA